MHFTNFLDTYLVSLISSPIDGRNYYTAWSAIYGWKAKLPNNMGQW